MKIQDILFLITLGMLIWKRDPRWTAAFGLVALVIAVPLFASWTFFTAERLTWYAAAFFLLAIALAFLRNSKEDTP